MNKSIVSGLACVIILCSAFPAKAQQQLSILSDTFNYSGWNTGATPMTPTWTSANGSTPGVVPNTTWISLNNALIYKNLGTTLSTDFELSFDVLQPAFSRGQWIGLFDSTGSNGYGFFWNSGGSQYYGSQGCVNIEKYTNITNNTWSNQGTALGSVYASGHNPGNTTSAALSAPFAHVVLTWFASTSTLSLFVDGKLINSIVDSSFSSFSRVYISGNGGGLYDNLSINTSVGASTPFGTNVLSDTFTYTGWSAMSSAGWVNANGGNPTIIEEASPNPPNTYYGYPNLSSSYTTLANGLIYRPLSRPLSTEANFSIAMDVLQNSYSRAQWVGLFDASGNGYVFSWNSGQYSQYNSQGLVGILKCSNAALTWSVPAGTLVASASSGHNSGNVSNAALTAPFAHFVLTWTASTNTLSLSVDGTVVCHGQDLSPLTSSFSRLYIGGNTSGLFTNLNVSTTCGAAVAFTTYEAEAATLSNGVTVSTMNPSVDGTSDLPRTEASGRAYATLSAQGQSITFNVTQAANSIVVRHNIPYTSPYNLMNGPHATLHLWVNNETTARSVVESVYGVNSGLPGTLPSLDLSSYHNEAATAYWEETRALISGQALSPGDTVRLEADSGDSAFPYNIDCIDLENVGAALTQPANTLSVKSSPYNAYGDGVHDDKTAIQNCITAAQSAGENVWIPTGTYNVSAQFTVPAGVKVYGAGMWYTNLIGTVINPYCPGFSLNTDSEVHDLYIDSQVSTSRGNSGGEFNASPSTGWVIQNVWITHIQQCAWMDDASYGTFNGCRVRFMYAGGIQLDADCNYCTITNCHIRGSGDDGIAIASDTNRSNPSNNNTAIYNTVVANWNAANFDLAGGTGNIIEYNYFADSGTDASFVINLPGAYPMYAVTGATITNNTIVRGGGDVGGQYRAAVWIFPQYAAVSGVTFSNNYILNSIWRGIEFEASGTMCSATTMTFNSNIINGIVNSTGDGIDITSGFSGNGTFTNNTVTVPTTAYKNSAPTTFTGSGSGNTPAFTFP